MSNYTPSVNILRDFNKSLNYIPTANSIRVFNQILDGFDSGLHSFTIIGSYGTGKSSFLWALEQNLRGAQSYFSKSQSLFSGFSKFDFINLVGTFKSLESSFEEKLKLKKGETVLDGLSRIIEEANENGKFVFIVLDEFGKHLEYAVKNNPEKELYFIQELAELVNDPNRNAIFISTLHQSFQSYGHGLSNEQRKEWEKVKGRLKELTFNEPVEQLLQLAASHLGRGSKKTSKEQENLSNQIEKTKLLPLSFENLKDVSNSLYPLDLLSAGCLTLALQRYGQNERSLFSFLNSNELRTLNHEHNPFYHLALVSDYLEDNFYSLINSKYNPDFIQWAAIKSAVQKAEGRFDNDLGNAIAIIKTIGLLNIFSSKSGKLDQDFLELYCKCALGVKNPSTLIKELEAAKIIKYVSFKQTYVLVDGTDLNIDYAIEEARPKIKRLKNQQVAEFIESVIDFKVLAAKEVSYKTGTPRFFETRVTSTPIEIDPVGEIDGFINIVVGSTVDSLNDLSFGIQKPIIYGVVNESTRVKEALEDIEAIKLVRLENSDDKAAVKELDELISQESVRLIDTVDEILFNSVKTAWIYNGKEIQVKGKKDLVKTLSVVSDQIYPSTPSFKSELVNKHKFSSSIGAARRNFFKGLVFNHLEKDLGISEDKFPPEKAIYRSLLQKTGIHVALEAGYVFQEPTDKSFAALWAASEEFLEQATSSKSSLLDFYTKLRKPPFKLKDGLIHFWIPTFLFIKRESFALFDKNGHFIPEITIEIIDLFFKSAKDFQIKGLKIDGPKLNLFHAYRSLLNQNAEAKVSNDSFIQTIKPFLVFYKQLPEYSKKTKNLSPQAQQLRDTIEKSKDPERTIFEEFPAALGYSDLYLSDDEDKLASYINQLDQTIFEIRNAYQVLLGRIEFFIIHSLGLENDDFDAYKDEILNKYQFLDQDRLPSHQKVFVSRLVSPLSDREAWLNSIVSVLLNKGLDKFRDEEISVFEERCRKYSTELENLRAIQNVGIGKGEAVYKVDVTDENGTQGIQVILKPSHKKELKSELNQIKKGLTKNIEIARLALIQVLKELSEEETNE